MRAIRTAALGLAASVCAFGALAQAMDQREARKQLFPAKGYEVEYMADSGLSETELGYFKLLVEGRNSRDQFGRMAQYYGAIAISPSVFQGGPAAILASPETVPFKFETGYHSVAAAEAAALIACNALVQPGQQRCGVAARILPKRYKPRPLSMSVFATDAFKTYRNAGKPKAFALSFATPGYGLADGAQAAEEALEICNAAAEAFGKRDCNLVVLDLE
jgi:hypothetical protein